MILTKISYRSFAPDWHDIMSAEKSKRHRKVAFVFFKPLTRKHSYEVAKKHEVRVFECIYDTMSAEKNKRHRKMAFVFFKPLTRKPSYEVAEKARSAGFRVYDITTKQNK